ncbi:hypothetical protein CQW23_27219 [Capsicum baccatum]|uniref:Miraculin n=1 Tax=Capsicum baccatum TaxID=33114 RepID=A0A2G2VD19_CAPBA|nr:hypothetical protein CQW23_27219 [Capsicum baccatum]
MKTLLLFLSLAIIIFLPLSTSKNQAWIAVRDTNGNPLNKMNRYWITPANHTENGGGVRAVVYLGSSTDLQQQKTTICPTSVVLSHSPTDDGFAVYFTPENPRYEKIAEFTPLNIHFSPVYPLCRDLTVWKVDNLLPDLPPAYRHTISTGAKLGNHNDVSSWFQIRPMALADSRKYSYKLVFCLQGITSYCQNIGIVPQNGYLRLVLSQHPMPFQFKLDNVIKIGMAAEA